MHIRKSALVNMHFLAYIVSDARWRKMRAYLAPAAALSSWMKKTQLICLYQCFLHSSPVVFDQRRTLGRYRKVKDKIEEVLLHGTTFPWAALTRLQAPKFFSDMIESFVGAVYLDSRGNLDIVRHDAKGFAILV